jgi:carotenoid cleavage dioxygenase-like enzyme
MMSRRETLGLLGASAVTLALTRSALGETPEPSLLPQDQRWLTHLTDGILGDQIDSVPTVEGMLPPELSGTLYRNGPGMFERDRYRKCTLLDGDGMIRAFTFAQGRVRFRTRFVATEKYLREASANRFLYPTWTTPAPGFFNNLPEIPAKSQAGITAVLKNGVLYAFDELGHPYALEPESLSTMHPLDPRGPDAQDSPRAYKAHMKTDGETGAWVLVGTSGQRRQQLHAVVMDAKGKPQAQSETPNPRGDYFHDFFWTGRHVVLDLNRRSARLETVVNEHFEFPTVSPHVQGHRYRFGYCAIGEIARSWFHDGVAKIDVESGKVEQFRFGPQCYVGEPVLVPRPRAQAEDAGWLLCEVLDGHAGLSDLAVFDAQAVSSGPVARVKLLHALPFSFHGWWQAA